MLVTTAKVATVKSATHSKVTKVWPVAVLVILYIYTYYKYITTLRLLSPVIEMMLFVRPPLTSLLQTFFINLVSHFEFILFRCSLKIIKML